MTKEAVEAFFQEYNQPNANEMDQNDVPKNQNSPQHIKNKFLSRQFEKYYLIFVSSIVDRRKKSSKEVDRIYKTKIFFLSSFVFFSPSG